MTRNYPALAVLGPTGSGKTRLSLTLAGQHGGEIVSCDALQVYRGMDIGTAKATAAERSAVPHHMLDLRTPDEQFSAGEYQVLARTILAQIRERGRVPVITGGTGLYFRALTDGLFEGPGRCGALRRRLRSIVELGGTPRLYRALARIDPLSAARIGCADSDRIVRAYEVWLASGKTMSSWQASPSQPLQDFQWLKLGIAWSRPALYARIDRRVHDMFANGFLREVEELVSKYPDNCHAFKAIGYRQVTRYLYGDMTLEQAIEETQRESRRYAKRQLTWFRADPEIHWLSGGNGEEAVALEAARIAEKFLQTCR